MPELTLAERELPGLESEIAILSRQASALSDRVRAAEAVSSALWVVTSSLEEAKGKIGKVVQAIADQQQAEREGIERAATHRAALAALDKLAGECEKAAGEAAALRARHSILVALCEFYRQAPVMILENELVPTLEEEANRFLAKCSSNRMRVRLETQKEIKSRDTLADGLEIYVSDWRGERCLDDYSGGQRAVLFIAFRVAWARVQERRSGAGIDMLSLDEIFDRLSNEDLTAAVEALRTLETEFSFIQLISHREEVKQMFANRILVTGGSEESRAELVTA